MNPYQRLWQAVIIEALSELAGNQPFADRKRAEHYKEKAYRWIFINNHDFHAVCDFAELSPHYVRLMAKEVLARKQFSFEHYSKRGRAR